MKAPLPPNEAQRLETLRGYDVLDTPPEPAFDDLALLAAQICQVPIAVVSLVDENRQWFKSIIGLSATETPRDVAFCAHAILHSDEVLEVRDAQLDPRFADNPLVTDDPHIRFYAGAPLVAPDGHALGTLCVIDHVPRVLSAEQKTALRTLSRTVIAQLELRRTLVTSRLVKEQLQSLNASLEQKIEARTAELQREMDVRRESEQRFRQLSENIREVFWMTDPAKDKMLYISPAYEQIWGRTVQSLYDSPRDWLEAIHGEDRPRVLQAALTKQMSGLYDEEYRIVRPNGEIRWIRDQAFPVCDSGGAVYRIAGVAEDITERMVAEAKLKRLADLYAALSQCNQAIVRCTSEEELFPQICRDAVQFGGMKMAWIGLLDEAGQIVKPVAAFGAGMEYLDGIQISVNADEPSGRGPIGIVMRENQPYWCQDYLNEPLLALWRERGARSGWGSSAALPLHRKGKVVGVFTLYASEVNAFDEAERNLLVEMAMDIDYALDSYVLQAERKQAEAELRESEARTKLILDMAMDAVIGTDQEGRIINWNSEAERMFGYAADRALGEELAEIIVPPAHRKAHRQGMRNFVATGVATIIGKRIEISGMRADGSEFPIELTISAIQRQGRYFFSAFVRDITERKQAEDKLRRRSEELAAMLEVSQEIAATLDVRSVLQTTTDRVTELTELKSAAIYLLEGETLRLSAETPPLPAQFPAALRNAPLADHPHIREVITTGQSVFILDTATAEFTPAERAVAELRGLRSICYLPLLAGTKVIGTLIVATVGEPQVLSEDEVGLCRTLANMAALAVENARLYESSQRYAADLEQRIIERKQTEETMRIAAVTFETQEAILITDPDAKILRVNQAFQDITGYSAAEVVGQNPRMLQSGRHDAAFYQAMWSALLSAGKWSGEVWDKRKDGTIYPKAMTITAVYDDNYQMTHYVAVFRDISNRKRSEQEIHQLAFYDPLTRLPNRRLLLDRLQQGMAVSMRNGHYGALLFLDLDHFKTINDTQGHAIGDLLLIEVARRLQTCVREGDSVARLGGDEFVVLLEELSGDEAEAASQTESVAEKIRNELGQPYLLKDYECLSTPSIGISLFRGHLESVEDLLKHADVAMYQAKAAGRNAIRFFDPDMQAILEARDELQVALRHALQRQQFRLYYQVQVDSLHRPLGAEVLLRWEHPERGLVSPAEFIPLAEETGLIVPIGLWVLQTACAQLKVWQQDAHTRELKLAVNVSARQFRQPDFVAQVQRVLQESGVKASRLKLELTESTVLENVQDTIDKMRELKLIGVHFSMDDFGTGYSSLQYLKQLPLDQIKIDQSFVRDIVSDPNDAAIVQVIIAMTEALALNVIAEGVETTAQYQFLDTHGCHSFQGYLFGRPMPVEEFESSLRDLS